MPGRLNSNNDHPHGSDQENNSSLASPYVGTINTVAPGCLTAHLWTHRLKNKGQRQSENWNASIILTAEAVTELQW